MVTSSPSSKSADTMVPVTSAVIEYVSLGAMVPVDDIFSVISVTEAVPVFA